MHAFHIKGEEKMKSQQQHATREKRNQTHNVRTLSNLCLSFSFSFFSLSFHLLALLPVCAFAIILFPPYLFPQQLSVVPPTCSPYSSSLFLIIALIPPPFLFSPSLTISNNVFAFLLASPLPFPSLYPFLYVCVCV